MATLKPLKRMVGLNWKDAFMEGNKLGIGFGSYSSYATEIQDEGSGGEPNFAIEGYYDFKVTDNISIKPAVFWSTTPTAKTLLMDQ